ncbi:MAG TPA: hypothetical protein VGN05_02295 [Parvibaculum sp.]|jgi:hypothetical protein
MAIRTRTKRLRKDAEALRDDARDLVEESFSHPAVDRLVDAIRERPVTAVVVTAAIMALSARFVGRVRHWGE